MRELVGARAGVRALEEAAFVAELFDRPCDYLRAMLRTKKGGVKKLMIGDIRKTKKQGSKRNFIKDNSMSYTQLCPARHIVNSSFRHHRVGLSMSP